MKILSIVERGEMMVVTTDNNGRNEFVYFKDQFNSKSDLLVEMQRSLDNEIEREDVKKMKFDKVKKDA